MPLQGASLAVIERRKRSRASNPRRVGLPAEALAKAGSMGLHKGELKSPFAREPGDETAGRGVHGGYEMPPGHGGAGESEVSPRVMKRRYVSLAHEGSMPDCATARGMQRESAASPLPRLVL